MDFAAIDLQPLWITLQLASLTVLILLLIGTPLAWWLAHTRSRWRVGVEAVVALPLVLPPTVLGFYLLIALGSQGFIGSPFETFTGSSLAFTFGGLVIASTLYSLPFVVQPLQGAFEALDQQIKSQHGGGSAFGFAAHRAGILFADRARVAGFHWQSLRDFHRVFAGVHLRRTGDRLHFVFPAVCGATFAGRF